MTNIRRSDRSVPVVVHIARVQQNRPNKKTRNKYEGQAEIGWNMRNSGIIIICRTPPFSDKKSNLDQLSCFLFGALSCIV